MIRTSGVRGLFGPTAPASRPDVVSLCHARNKSGHHEKALGEAARPAPKSSELQNGRIGARRCDVFPLWRFGVFGALLLPLLAAGAAAADEQQSFTYREMGVAVLQALDKVTARISTLTMPLERTTRFGTLEVTVWACRKRPPEEPPESAVFLTIVERRRGASSVRLFQGWMFASSPAMSALEHPVYDIWALDCIDAPRE